MDILTVGGLLIGWGALIASVILDGGSMSGFVKLSPFILVIFGSVGAASISMTMEDLLQVPGVLKKAFINKRKMAHAEIVQTLVRFSQASRREGLLVLENEANKTDDLFLKKGLQLVVDGVDMNNLKAILETDITTLKHRHKIGEEYFMKLGGFGPTLGIIGTVLGLVHMLSNLSEPGTMGPAIASAFIATLYGVSSANLLYLPIANKLKTLTDEEVLEKRIILEGLIALQAGENPTIIEERLLSFIRPKKRSSSRSKKAA